MGIPLRVLMAEDSRADAELVRLELQRGGYEPVVERVDTPEAMKEALESQTWDLTLSDYVMPRFSGPAALKLAQDMAPDLPFIVVTGQVGEETAVEVMKAGAHDYIFKSNLVRLVPAVRRELQDAVVRRERREADRALRQANAALEQRVEQRTAALVAANRELEARVVEQKRTEEALRKSEGRFRLSVENLLDAFAIYSSIRNPDGEIVGFRVEYVNDVACKLTGRKREDYVTRTYGS